MKIPHYEPFCLLFGDLAALYLGLWLTLAVRYLHVPSTDVWVQHAVPFSLLFLVTICIYFITGLYDQHTLLVRQRLPSLVGWGQLISVLVAAFFFFSVPSFGIAPKTNLLIFLVLSSVLVVSWRIMWARVSGFGKRRNALMLGVGSELDELAAEIDQNPRYGLHVAYRVAPEDVLVSEELRTQLSAFVTKRSISTIIVDMHDAQITRIMPVLYSLLFSHPHVIVLDAMNLYESIFRRIPVSLLEDVWFVQYASRKAGIVYRVFHRIVDFVMGVVVGVVWLLTAPVVWVALRYDDRGPLYIEQERLGEHDRPISIKKYRTMSGSDSGDHVLKSSLRVTRVGAVLRPTRIDELPQCLSLLRGDLSFVGPRPELPALAQLYADTIPYYRARHLIRPGLTGWAQLYHDAHPHHGANIEETRNKLSYDLYYLKHRSVLLDLEIIMKTIKKIVTRSGA